MATLLVLLDYFRAFDVINVPLLLSKLSYYGCHVNTVKWFHSYLSSRSQLVQVPDKDSGMLSSSPKQVTRGVPQGSILGPLLFILYTADITNCFINTKYHLYADDLQVYLHFKPQDVAECVTKINEDLYRITEWSARNSLVLNPSKCKFMVMGSREMLKRCEDVDFHVVVGESYIERVQEARNLGLIFDGQLHFESHVTEAVRNCFYRLKLLYKIRPYINTDLRIKLCESLILSKLNYADTVYGPCILGKTAKLIQRIQNACARFCYQVPPRWHITPFLNSGNLMKMDARRKLHLASLMFGVVLWKTPEYLYRKLVWSRDVSSRNTRASSYLLLTPNHRTAAFRGSFKFAATHCWNALLPPFRAVKSVKSFKNKFKKYLLTQQKENL